MLFDTSGLLCYHNSGDPQHTLAKTYFRSHGVRLTHSYVLSEFITLAHARRLARPPVLAFVNALFQQTRIEIIWVHENLHREAMLLLGSCLDKDYSLCDAVSFVLMKQRGMTEALTTDHHFEQEGFQCLLKN